MLFFVIILVHECSTIKLPLRIYGGTDAKLEEYSYVVRLERRISYNFTNNTVIATHEHFCTASALSAVWLITAAHCLEMKYPYIIMKKRMLTVVKMVIRYGHVESSPSTNDTFGDVLETIMHPHYVIQKNLKNGYIKYSRNDIGLLKTSPIKVGSYIKLSAVDCRSVYGQEAIMGGFGLMATKDDDDVLVTNDTLSLRKPLQLLKVSFIKCTPGKKELLSLCLSSTCHGRTSACPGDSGGPVMHPSGLLAVISAGDPKPCFKKNISRAFSAGTITPVSPYIEWIYSYVTA